LECFFYRGFPKCRKQGKGEPSRLKVSTLIRLKIAEAFKLDIESFNSLEEILNSFTEALNLLHRNRINQMSVMGSPTDENGEVILAEDIYFNEPFDNFVESVKNEVTYYLSYGYYESKRRDSTDFSSEIGRRQGSSDYREKLFGNVQRILAETSSNKKGLI